MTYENPSKRTALVIYESMFGCTEQIARAIGDGLASTANVEVRDVQHGHLRPDEMPDLLVIGGPTHAFSMSRESSRLNAVAQGARLELENLGIREWIGRMPVADRERHMAIATFDTKMRRARHVPGSAAKAAAKRLRRLGYPAAAEPRTFLVNGIQGPVAGGELAAARSWGSRLGTALAVAMPDSSRAGDVGPTGS